MKKKLIKRLEELAIENDLLRKELNNNCEKGGYPKSTVREMLFGETKSIPDSQDFKKGDILIREWKEKDLFDFCTFEEKLSDNSFKCTDFCKFIGIIKKDEIKNYVAHYKLNMSIYSLRYNWRKATPKQIEELNKLLGKEEKEVWWLCNKWCGNSFTKGKEYKQVFFSNDSLTLIDNHFHRNVVSTRNFTKIEENKELEEAKEYLNGYAKGAYPIKPKLKKSIETVLKHLSR